MIKQFSYLLPELEDCRLTIVRVVDEGEREDPDEGKLARLVSTHYSNAHFKKLYGRPNSELFAFSNMLTPSTADPLIRNLNLPVFIAHP